MTNGKQAPESGDPFDETRSEIEALVQQAIKDSLLPYQTKKISKKLVEQVAAECAEKIAVGAIAASRKASSRHASKVTRDFTEFLKNQEPTATPIFNDKLAAMAEQLSNEDIEKLQSEREIAKNVVSRVYKSIFDFALDLGLKNFEGQPQDKDKKK